MTDMTGTKKKDKAKAKKAKDQKDRYTMIAVKRDQDIAETADKISALLQTYLPTYAGTVHRSEAIGYAVKVTLKRLRDGHFDEDSAGIK